MALDNLQVDYLIDPAFQIENLAGKPAVGGHIEVFEAGTDTKVITYQDFDGNVNPFKIPLHSDGRAVILADPSRKYDFYVYDSFNNLMFSRLNVTPNISGNISIKGSDVYIYNTDGTLDITQQSIQNNIRRYEINTKHKSLGVEAPLYFVEDSDSATIIGFSGDDFASKEYVDSAVSAKLDTTAFSTVSGDFLTDKFEYDDDNNITAYNHSAFAGGGGSGPNYEAGDHIAITDNVISVTGLPDSADLENAITSAVTNVENKFEYNENNYITAYNNSAFAGKEYSAGDGISIVNNTISVTAQGGGIEHDDTLSGNGNSIPLGIANVEDFVKQNDLTAYQEKGDYYSASNPSGFITNDALTGLQPSGDYATHDDLTGYATTSLVSSVSSELYSAFSGISGDYELVAGSGVELVDDPNAKTTTINVTAEGTPVTAIQMMIESATSGLQPSGDYATTAQVADKLDTTAFSTVSGDFLTAHQDISNLMPKSESANFYPMTGNPSGFLTAHQDLSNYATTAELANKLDTTAFSDVSGSFLTAVPAGTMNESNFSYDASNNITAYNGSAFKAGAGGLTVCAFSAISSDFGAFRNTIKDNPEKYAVSFTSRNNIRIAYFYSSGAGASPDPVYPNVTDYFDVYTYRIDDNTETSSFGISHSYKDYGGFTAQESTQAGMSTDTVGGSVPEVVSAAADYVSATSANINSTIDNVSANSGVWGGSALPISAGPGIDVQLVDDKLIFSAIPNETVLFEGDALHNNATATLSEPFTNFEKIKVYGHTDDGTNYPWFTEVPTFSGIGFIGVATNNAGWSKWFGLSIPDTTHIVPYTGYVVTWAGTSTGYLSNTWGITRVIGINRIAGGN